MRDWKVEHVLEVEQFQSKKNADSDFFQSSKYSPF